MFRSIAIGMLVLGLASFCAVSASASSAVLGEEFGSGVHAYFAGDFIVAHERLTDVIDAGTQDPRAFYFRGLVYLKLGRGPEAEVDFRHGAELESKDLNRFYNVGKSLERVQGNDRVKLERFRVEARMAAMEHAEKIRKARYEAIRREEARVLREQALAAPKEPIESVPTPSPEAENPFAVPDNKPAPPAAKPDAGENPFAEEPKEQPDVKEDPFTEEPKETPDAKEDPFAEEPKETPDAKEPPPGDDGKEAPEDPFADEPTEKEPAAKEPAAKEPTEKEPAAKEPAEKEPAAKEPAAKEPAEKEPAAKEPAEEKKSDPNDPFAFAT